MRLLDLFCCAGGAAMGYFQAGFDEIDGIDIVFQRRYPFNFIQSDTFKYLRDHGHEYDAVHASPPCQGYTRARHLRGYDHPLLIEPLRDWLDALGKPYVIENVVGAPLIPEKTIKLNGPFFNLLTLRERLFECSFPVEQPNLPKPQGKHAKMGRPPKEGEYITVVGNFSGVAYARKVMGIDWMVQKELKEAIPPVYTRWIGARLLQHIKVKSYLNRE